MHTLCVALTAVTFAVAQSFVHPGVFIGRPQLDFVKQAVAAKTQPIFDAFNKAVASPLGSLAYQIRGPPASGVIECGSYSKPNNGCSAEDADASAAFLQAVLYYITGTRTYISNSIAILNAYGHNLRKYNNSNAPLQAGWGASKWGRAAELVINSDGKWERADVDAFVRMLTNVSLPLIDKGSDANGNWELTQIEGFLGIAVFLNDTALFERGITYWTERTRAYWYNIADGIKPIPAPRGTPSWYGQTVFNASTNGVAQETCRDFGHTSYSIAATFNAAETALLQGVNLYANGTNVEFDIRMATSLEFHATYLNGAKVPKYLCNGTVTLEQMPTFELGYNRLSTRNLAGNLTQTYAHILSKVRTNADPVDEHMIIYETLTHGIIAPGQ